MAMEYSEAEFLRVARDLRAFKMYCLASFFMLFYDIVITFGDEVERIWKRKFTWFTLLWFLNRYLSPLGFIVVTASFQDPRWTGDACNHYVYFPEVLRIFTTSITGLVFIIRLYATYSKNRTILLFGLCFLATELGVKIWSFLGGRRLELPPGLFGCVLTSGPDSLRFTCTWIAELIFDSVIFVLTLLRTLSLNRHTGSNPLSLVNLILRDGLIYFAVILISNTVTVLTFLLAPSGLKPINAPFTVSITTLMVSRLILNLRSKDTTICGWEDGAVDDAATSLYDKTTRNMEFAHEMTTGVKTEQLEPAEGSYV